MTKIARRGDADDGGGTVDTECSTTVFLNGQPIALVGSKNTAHGRHQPSPILDNDTTIFVEGKKVARVGDQYECGHKIIQGSDSCVGD